jgi:hypothetical protein
MIVIAVLFAATAVAAKSAPYHPHIDPANFQTAIDHPYYPLVPGTSYRLIEKQGKQTSENEITVTHDTKVIMGVTCVVVRDVERENGVVTEETNDWFAQDTSGNVWCFGEDTKEHDGDEVSTEGSWQAGVGRNQPGIIMPAHPKPGPAYRQEYSPGNAEDMGQIVAVNDSVTVPYGTFRDCVRTKEWSLLEPGTEKKWYAKGIGLVRTESTTKEVAVLVSVTKP